MFVIKSVIFSLALCLHIFNWIVIRFNKIYKALMLFEPFLLFLSINPFVQTFFENTFMLVPVVDIVFQLKATCP